MFNTMKKVLNKPNHKLPAKEEIDKISSYIFCRWLSGSPYVVQAANVINQYDIPMENQFLMINSAFGGKIKYIPYPKNSKKEDSKIQEIIAKHFKINLDLANEYIELMDKEELDFIVSLYQG